MHNGVTMHTFPNPAAEAQKRSAITPLSIVLGLVLVFFCAILVFVYVTTKRIHPVMLDQHGAPVDSQPRRDTTSPPAAEADKPVHTPAAHQ